MSDDKILEHLSFDTMKFCTHQIEENDAAPIPKIGLIIIRLRALKYISKR